MLAGASVAALVVPQGMSYARLAGLPQEYGLHGAFVPVMVYAALGSSRHLVSVFFFFKISFFHFYSFRRKKFSKSKKRKTKKNPEKN